MEGKVVQSLVSYTDGFSPVNLIGLLDQICESKEKIELTKISTMCRQFRKTHNIKKMSNSTRPPNTKLNELSGEHDSGCSSGYTTPTFGGLR